MRIRPLPTRKPRLQPVKYGEGSHGKRKLIKAVMDAGYSVRIAQKAVDAVIGAWKQSLAAHEQVELPLGVIKVKKTPKNIFRKRYTAYKVGKDGVKKLYTWTTYNDPYRVIWRIPNEDEWRQLLRLLNPGITEGEVDTLYAHPRARKAITPPKPEPSAPRPPIAFVPKNPFAAVVSTSRSVPSRTRVFQPRRK